MNLKIKETVLKRISLKCESDKMSGKILYAWVGHIFKSSHTLSHTQSHRTYFARG